MLRCAGLFAILSKQCMWVYICMYMYICLCIVYVYLVCCCSLLPCLTCCQRSVYDYVSVYVYTRMLQRVGVFDILSKQCTAYVYVYTHSFLERLYIQDKPHQEEQATFKSKDIETSDWELPWRHTSIHLSQFHASLYSLLQRCVAIFAILSKQCVRVYICVYAYTYATTCCCLCQSVETMHVRGYLYTYS